MNNIKSPSSLFYDVVLAEFLLSLFMVYSFPKLVPEIAYMYNDGELPFYFYGYNSLFLFTANVFYAFELIFGIFLGCHKFHFRLLIHVCLLILMIASIFGVFRYLSMTLKSLS